MVNEPLPSLAPQVISGTLGLDEALPDSPLERRHEALRLLK